VPYTLAEHGKEIEPAIGRVPRSVGSTKARFEKFSGVISTVNVSRPERTGACWQVWGYKAVS